MIRLRPTAVDDAGRQVRLFRSLRLCRPHNFTPGEWKDLRRRVWRSSPAPYILWLAVFVVTITFVTDDTLRLALDRSPLSIALFVAGAAAIALLLLLTLRSIPLTTPAQLRKSLLRLRRCPACAHPLSDVAAGNDGRTVCPECSATWRLPD